jgi:hypothetical protein
MADQKIAVVFTFKSVEAILRVGGTSSWRLDRNNARKCEYAVCTRNAYADRTEGKEEHRAAFLIGKVKDVVPTPDPDCPERFLIQFSEYALVTVPGVWKGDRNPYKYAGSLQELGIDASKLKWKKMPEPTVPTAAPQSVPTNGVAALTMAEAKKGLAITFGVAPEAIEITIRG